ncbi:MAG: hypothetical protein ACFE0J_12545 [Elainellaceae cyanobacterium]
MKPTPCVHEISDKTRYSPTGLGLFVWCPGGAGAHHTFNVLTQERTAILINTSSWRIRKPPPHRAGDAIHLGETHGMGGAGLMQ